MSDVNVNIDYKKIIVDLELQLKEREVYIDILKKKYDELIKELYDIRINERFLIK